MATKAKEMEATLATSDRHPLRQIPTAAIRIPTTPVISVKKPSCWSEAIFTPATVTHGKNDPAITSVKPSPVMHERKVAKT